MSIKKPRVSVVIPAYNEAAFVGNCLRALAEQTVRPHEVMVVDNNSSDETAKIAKGFPFVTLLRERRPGLRHTRNTGMDAATGEVVGRLDADAVPDATWVEELQHVFADPSVNAATGPCYYYDMPARGLGLSIDRSVRKLIFRVGEPLLYGSNMAMRREAWRAIRPHICMQGEFFEDYDLSFHLREAGYRITFDPKLVVGVATRILDNSPREFFRTMQQHTTTFAMHGQRNRTAEMGKYVYLSTYPILKMLHDTYDPASGKFALKAHKPETRRSSNT